MGAEISCAIAVFFVVGVGIGIWWGVKHDNNNGTGGHGNYTSGQATTPPTPTQQASILVWATSISVVIQKVRTLRNFCIPFYKSSQHLKPSTPHTSLSSSLHPSQCHHLL